MIRILGLVLAFIFIFGLVGCDLTNNGTTTTTVKEANMAVKMGDVAVPDDTGDIDLGNVGYGGYKDFTFTIENNGTDNLTLSGNPNIYVTGTNFKLQQDTSADLLMPGEKTYFKIRFTANNVNGGVETGTISILNTDKKKNPYNFFIKATCANSPVMNVSYNNNSISDETVNYDGGINFVNTKEITFTVKNTGNSPLSFTGSPIVSVTGTGFSLKKDISTTTLAINTETTFVVVVSTTVSGDIIGTISIASNDTNRNPYNFSFKVKALALNELPDSDLKTDVNIEGSFISWGGVYDKDVTTDDRMRMKKSGTTYYKLFTVKTDVTTTAFAPSWVTFQVPAGYNGLMKFKTGNVWGDSSSSLATWYDYGTETMTVAVAEGTLFTVNKSKLASDKGGANLIAVKLETGKTYLFILDTVAKTFMYNAQ